MVPVSVTAVVLDRSFFGLHAAIFNPSFRIFPYSFSSWEAGFTWLEHSLPIVPVSYFSISLHISQGFSQLTSQPVLLHVILAVIFGELKVQVSNPLSSVSLYFTNFLFHSDLQILIKYFLWLKFVIVSNFSVFKSLVP